MPNKILIRAYEILLQLEKNNLEKKSKKDLIKSSSQLKLSYNDLDYKKIKDLIESIDINTINPVQALVKLNEIVETLKSSKK